MQSPIRTLAFVINDTKSGASEVARALAQLAQDAGVSVRQGDAYPSPPGFLAGCDACCVIGGDGTLLGVVGEAAREQIPIIGVNRGSLGFLTTFSAEEAKALFPSILKGDYCVARRSLLECSIGENEPELALNDVLIKDDLSSRLARLEVFADDELVTEYYCDGLIFSTPTGSTAYNLSAGGPLIHPSAEVIAMTPICPHTLSNRSIIFNHETKLRVFHRGPNARSLIAIDGQRKQIMVEKYPIEISLSPTHLLLAQRRDYSHFAVVRTKLKWSGGYAENPNPRA